MDAPTRARRCLAIASDGAPAGERFEATDVAAAADEVRVVHDLDMADVTRAALGAPVDATLGDDARSDAGPDLDDDHVVVGRGDPRAPLAEGEHIDVVVHPYRCRVALREPLPDRISVPARHDGWRRWPAGPELHRPGYRRHPRPTAARGRSLGWHRVASNSASTRARHTSGPAAMSAPRHSAPGSARRAWWQRRRCWWRPGRPPGCARHPTGTRVAEVVGHPCCGPLTLDHQAALEQLTHALGDDTPAETGPVDQLGTRATATQSDLVEHADQGVERIVGQARTPAGTGSADTPTLLIRHALSVRSAVEWSTFALDM